jgi:hypothetical protein
MPKFIIAAQGSEAWHESRCGLITASKFTECRKKLKTGANKGGYSSVAEKYAFKLACERISGELLDCPEFTPWQARRGNELEPEARARHELECSVFVDEVGLCVSDCGSFGASVDGTIDDDGISEYKCYLDPLKIKEIILSGSTEEVDDQVQGGLWITGRKYSHFCLYCPPLKSVGLDFNLIEIERNEAYIEELESDLKEFNNHVNNYVNKIKEKSKKWQNK